jgi:hypothetical protein
MQLPNLDSVLVQQFKVQEVADTKLPKGYTIEFSGLTKEEITSSGQSAVIFD